MESCTSSNASNSTGRRQFLKSLFGLGGVLEPGAGEAREPVQGLFYWADLRTGQVGFPTGHTAPPGLPGSLMKIVATAALKQDNLISPDKQIECTGRVLIKRRVYHCQVAHGKVDLVGALGKSCNVYFAQAAQAISVPAFFQHARDFGLFAPVAGFPYRNEPAAPHDDVVSYALGLSADVELNALQILRMVALVGTRGVLPALHSAESPPQNEKPFRLEMEPSTWALLAQGMRLAARQGTAKKLDPEDKLRLAVKTGTAPHGKTFQSWIAGYFPCESPRHAFCARAFSGTSQDQAVPLAKKYLFATEWP